MLLFEMIFFFFSGPSCKYPFLYQDPLVLGVGLAVEDPEAVEVAEVVVDNQDLPTFVETLRVPGAMICLMDPAVGA
jgi:hypothetical protein